MRILALSAHELIAAAYRLKDYQVFGPGDLDSTRFDIEATLPNEAVALADSTKSKQIWLMTQTLFAERFGIREHRATRKIGALELAVDTGGAEIP